MRTMRVAGLVAAGLLPLPSTAAPAYGQAARASIPAIVMRASSVYASEMRGYVGMERHFTTQLQGGPFAHGEQSESAEVFADGKFVRLAYYRIVRDGHPYSAAQIAERTDQANKAWAAGKVFFKEPYDARYSGDYTFAPAAACASCSPGVEGVRFTSLARDAQHGDGTMQIETQSGHVVKLTYVPNVLPPHATSGLVTESGEQVRPHLWYVARIEQTYQGRAFVFSGTGTFTGRFDHFRRLPSLAAAETALLNQTI